MIAVLAVVCSIAGLAYWWYSDSESTEVQDPLAPQHAVDSGEDPADTELESEKQKEVWKCEHTTFEIERKFGSRFLQAWKSRDSHLLQELILPDCEISLSVSEPDVRTHGDVSETVRTANADVFASPDELVSFLISSVDDFEQILHQKFKVLRIKSHPDNRWTIRLLLGADGTTSSGGFISWSSEHDVTCHFSTELQLESSAVLEQWKLASVRRQESTGRMFREVTANTGLESLPLPDNWNSDEEARQYHFQLAVDDFNNDQFPDVAVMTEQGMPYLLQSKSGKSFTNRPELLESLRLYKPSSGVCWIDYDNDGFQDLLIANRLLHNEGGQNFQDVTETSQLDLEQRPQGYTVVDFDCDGHLDLYVLYQHPYGRTLQSRPPKKTGWIGDHSSGGENQLWRNLGNGRFRNVTRETLAGDGFRHTFAASWFFHDDDHYPDVYIANDLGRNSLLRNTGRSTFKDVTRTTGTGDFATSMGVATGDVNNDGRTEIYVANMYSKMGRRIIQQVGEKDYPPGVYDQIKGSCAGNRLYEWNSESDSYQDAGERHNVYAVGWAYAPTFADFDNDGWQDIYATTGFLSFNRSEPDG